VETFLQCRGCIYFRELGVSLTMQAERKHADRKQSLEESIYHIALPPTNVEKLSILACLGHSPVCDFAPPQGLQASIGPRCDVPEPSP
jgi:hypothetical protein